MSKFSAGAVRMADAGWFVFPLRPGDKRPQAGTAGQDDATNDVERVLQWWTDMPTANVGVHCRPSGLYVIDLDRPGHGGRDGGPDGVETWRTLIDTHGNHPTTMVRTPSGGIHLYYRAPAGVELPNSAGRLGPGIDTRGNGYVVAPPSVTHAGEYAPFRPGGRPLPLAPLPSWIIDAFAPKPVTPPPAFALGRQAPPADVRARLMALHDEIVAAPDGEGNHTCARVAFLAGQYVGAGQVSADEAARVLVAGLSCWTFRRESDFRIMEGTIRRQIATGSLSPRAWRP